LIHVALLGKTSNLVGVFKTMKALQLISLAAIVLLLGAAPVFAQAGAPQSVSLSGAGIGAGIGVALAIVGAGYGFGRIGSAALESMARQPEIAGQIQTGMIVIAALLEGATFFGLLICLLLNNKSTW
jgi:F-type H+-transporting ATPase subunit c